MAYSDKVLDHYENPRNVGAFDKGDESIGTGMVGAPACGDVMKLQIKVSAEGVIEDAKFKTFGCGSAIASSSLVTEWVKGKTVDEAMTIHQTFLELMQGKGQVEPDEDVLEDGIAFAGVAKFPARVKCALLSWMAWKDATAQSLEKEKA